MNQAQHIAQQALERARNRAVEVSRSTLAALVEVSPVTITQCPAEQTKRRRKAYKPEPTPQAAAFAQYLEEIQSGGAIEAAAPDLLAEFEQALAAEVRSFKRRR